MRFEIQDVAFTHFPNQEDRSITTARIALIIDYLGDEFTLCPFTKQLNNEAYYKYTIQVEKDSEEGRAMNLDFSSLLIFDRLFDMPKFLLLKKTGRCPDSLIEKIEELLEEMKRNGDCR